jgi:rSAM/selenodomain-associated transferase 1
MARPVVILFARAPRLGGVKRRLAAGIGDVPALRFYRNALGRILRHLRGLRGFEIVLAITPDRAAVRPAPRFAVIGQGEGDLDIRMTRAFRRYPRRHVLLIGADIPDLDGAVLRAGAKALRGHDAVFGPAEDGGYYLVGMGARRPARPFATVRWSGPHALADTLKNFRGRRVAYLPVLQDVDNKVDLDRVQNSTLRRCENPLD